MDIVCGVSKRPDQGFDRISSLVSVCAEIGLRVKMFTGVSVNRKSQTEPPTPQLPPLPIQAAAEAEEEDLDPHGTTVPKHVNVIYEIFACRRRYNSCREV